MADLSSRPINNVKEIQLVDPRLIQYTRDFLTQKKDNQGKEIGPWRKLVAAHTQLKAIINQYKAETLQGENVAYHPELTEKEREDLLIGHGGLNGEFNNGPNMVIPMLIEPALQAFDQSTDKNSKLTILVERINSLVNKLEDVSQLRKSLPGFGGEVAKKLGWVGDAQRIVIQETARQALNRVADQIDLWAKMNLGVISPQDIEKVSKQLQHYRSGLEDLDRYCQQIEQCRATVVPPPAPSNETTR